MLSNSLRLNFCYLEIIHILYPRYHLKIIRYKYLRDYMIKYNENEDENENRSHKYNINRPCLDMDTYIVN